MTHGAKSRLQQNPWHFFRNDSGESIPAFAVMRPTGTIQAFGATVFTCAKPNATSYSFYLINGPGVVRDGQFGQCTYGPDVVVLYDTGSSPALDEDWGPTNGSWKIATAGTGFRIVGVADAVKGIIEVIQVKTAAASTVHWGTLSVVHSPGAEQTITTGSWQTVTFSTGSDSGGVITADAANDKMTLAAYDYYLMALSMTVSASADAVLEVAYGADGAILTGYAIPAFNVNASAGVMPISSVILVQPATSSSTDEITVKAYATTNNVKINSAKFVMVRAALS